jgi:phosphoglycerate dehydrogenase-like enzyme
MPDVHRVAVLDDYQRAAQGYGDWDSLGNVEVAFFPDHLLDDDDIVGRLEPYDVVVATRERTRFPAELLNRLPALRLLISTGMSTAHIDLPTTRERGITVCGTQMYGEAAPSPASELTWALIMELTKGVAREDAGLRAGGWGTALSDDLAGSTLGLIGLGRLGSKVARVGLAFDMRVIAWSQNLDPQRAESLGVQAVDKETVLRESDILSIHTLLSRRTRGLLGAADLALLKPTALLINTSRGPIIDEAALIEVLAQRRIRGAGLDVFDVEPLPADHPLRSAPNTVLTPHVGYVSHASYRGFYTGAVADIVAYRRGEPVNVLNG